MTIEKATYSYTKIFECIAAIKEFNFAVDKKQNHFPKWNELKQLYNLLFEKTNCILFDPDFDNYIEDYGKAVYNYKQYTKKELDQKLKYCKNHIQNNIHEIHVMMETGEVNTEE